MTPCTRQALHAATLFAILMAILDVLVFFLRLPPPGPGEGWVLLLGLVWLFPAAFAVWWVVFRKEKMALWHALYAGALICLVWNVIIMGTLMAFNLVTSGPDAAAATARLALTFLPAILFAPLDGAIKFILLALGVRWWQLKRTY